METAGARVLHLDVMDGHFVPNITFGPPLVRAIRRTTDLWLDAHLMVTEPLRFLEPFASAGADSITIHWETHVDFNQARVEADRLGVHLGLSIRPDTEVGASLGGVVDLFDLVLLMTVMPGFGGQEYLPGSGVRIREAAGYCARSTRKAILEVDGGIKEGTAREAASSGATWFVAGNAVFRAPEPAIAFRRLETEIRYPE
jgi:ribulose-phosphate 3-epimerase